MVFSSIPAYLDLPNWPQQQNHQAAGSSNTTITNPHLQPPGPPPPPPLFSQPHVGGSGGSIRPGSLVDRAWMANIPLPEAALKCPRCESTNTKFCYFNNYSLSQPRHFCKSCRRYWTRGGALRNVPVGGGFRRNKRSKGGSSSSNSKSPASSSGGDLPPSLSTGNPNLSGLSPQFPPLRFMAPLHHHQLISDHEYGTTGGGGDIGLNYNGILAPNDMSFQLGGGGSNSFGSTSGGYLSQISLLGGLERQSGLYPFQGGLDGSGYGGELGPRPTSGMSTQVASVKMEDNENQLNLSRQLLGMPMPGGNDQYWRNTSTSSGAAVWTDLSGFNTSSTSNPL